MFPDVTEAFSDWTSTISFQLVTQTIYNFEVTNSSATSVYFNGVLEPLTSQSLLIKKEGERTWKWWNLWTTQSLNLNDFIQDTNNKIYKVMKISDWKYGGYYEYELTEKFQ